SFPDLSAAPYHVLIATQFLQATRPTRVVFVGADADLGAQAELIAVIEARARVDHDRRRIDRCGEAPRRVGVAGDDRVGMLRAVTGDMLDRFVEVAYYLDRQNQIEKLGRIVLLAG